MTYFWYSGVTMLLASLLCLPAATFAQQRVVSVGGDVTEIIYSLGEGGRVVATDSTSVFPPEAANAPKIGYVRQLAAEGILSVEPDMILISGAAGPKPALELLRASGVTVIEMQKTYTVASILAKTRTVAAALQVPEAGRELAAKIEADWAAAKQEIDAMGMAPSMLFFATLRNGAPRAAGADTAAHGVISMLGGRNVFGDQNGYETLSMEAAVAADPDVILVMAHHADRVGGVEDVVSHPSLSLTTAAQTGMIFLVDPVTVMQFGPRTPSAIAALGASINAALSARSNDD